MQRNKNFKEGGKQDIEGYKKQLQYSLEEKDCYDIPKKWVNIPPEQYDEISKPIKALTSILEEDNIKKQIEALKSEKCPSNIKTTLGMRTWHYDQNLRIKQLENQSKEL